MSSPSFLYLTILLSRYANAVAPACAPEAGRNAETIAGQIAGGELFEKSTTEGWMLRLSPDEYGWFIQLLEKNYPDEDMSRLTPPLHGPNPRILAGWHFRNSTNTGLNDGSINMRQQLRDFIFSPEINRIIGDGDNAVSSKDIEIVNEFGRGWLYLDAYVLTPPFAGKRASFETISFTVCLTWPETADAE